MSFRTKWAKAKVVIMGSSGVGKTAFTVRYLTKRFIGEYDANHEEIYTHKVIIDKDEVILDIVDTTSGDESRLTSNIRSADGFILLYSLVDRESFEKIHYYYYQIQNNKKSDHLSCIPIAIVGTKRDLDHVRRVTHAEGCDLSKKYGCPHYEISIAENPDEVYEVMVELMKQMKREFNRSLVSGEKHSTLDNMKRVFRKKITRSKSDSYH